MDRRRFCQGLVALSGLQRGIAMSADALITRPIPASGDVLPVVGLGTWQVFDVAAGGAEYGQARATMQTLVDGGGQLVDSSPMYGRSESVTGDAMQELGARRKLFVATKVWTRGREAGIEQMNTSLSRLRVETCDLMQVHNLTDTAIQLATIAKWREQKRIRYSGITHYHAGAHADLERALKKYKVEFVQVNYSLAEPEAEQRLLGACRRTGRGGADQPSLRRGRHVWPGTRQGRAGMDRRRTGNHQLGSIFPQVDTRQPGGDLRHPRHPQSQAPG